MNRQRRRLPSALAWIPWWLSVILAIVSYLSLKHLAPSLAATSAACKPLAEFLPQIAPLAAMAFLLLAAVLLYEGDDDTSLAEKDTEKRNDRNSG